MSKKKAFSGSTMTLKDFHGGSIPSDISLPSAPAAPSSGNNKPPDRWGPQQIRPDRTRPGSAPSAHNNDRVPPIMSVPANMGRNFEEDERKPFNNSSSNYFQRVAPLMSTSARSDRDPKPHPRFVVGQGPNAWGANNKKEADNSMMEDLSSRFVQASAIDMVSSGRWQLKMDNNNNSSSSSFHSNVEEIRPRSNEERPKLNLLPRTQLNESSRDLKDEKQGHVPVVASRPVHLEIPYELPININMPRPGSAGEDVGGHASGRPKLNLKPRSLPVEQSEESIEKERKSVFGGARPRELVLKERGIDDIIATSEEVTSPAIRIKSEASKPDKKPNNLGTLKKEIRPDNEKVDNAQRASWRNNNWKSSRENEKRPEPDTWRKPTDPLKPEAAARPGKVASALELAQAFSRPSSDSQPERVHVPFSRLTDTRNMYPGPGSRRINGY